MLSENRKPNMACVTRQAIENREYGSRCRVLHRNDESVDIGILKCTERSCEADESCQVCLREELRRRLMAVAVWFALISDDHGQRRYPHS